VETAQIGLDAGYEEYPAGRDTFDFLVGESRHMLDAERAIHPEPADQVPFFERHWLQTLGEEDINRARFDAGRIPVGDVHQSTYERTQAELWLLEARRVAGNQAMSPSPPL